MVANSLEACYYTSASTALIVGGFTHPENLAPPFLCEKMSGLCTLIPAIAITTKLVFEALRA